MPTDHNIEYYLTASTERILIRRGDPLGFRAAADAFADILAPGLTNRTHDARWLSLLSWIIVRVSEARKKLNLDHGEAGLARQRAIYEWIRPLELMWIERAVRTLRDRNLLDRRQLPGRNALLKAVETNGNTDHFGMTHDQFFRYRFIGPHGAYRTLLGRLPNMTIGGDGHRPGPLAQRLAKLVHAPPIKLPPSHKGRKPGPVDYWRDAWKGRHTRLQELIQWLPGRWDAKPNLFPDERRLLESVLFDAKGDAERRRIVANAAVHSRATTHADLCHDLVKDLSSKINRDEADRLSPIVPFTKFADAGIDAMVAIWQVTKADVEGPTIELDVLAHDSEVKAAMERLVRTGEKWRALSKKADGTLLIPAHTMAAAVTRRQTSTDRLRMLLQHHLDHGGGRRWFRFEGKGLVPDAPTGGNGATPYRFRLWSLGRLAWQTGLVDRMPRAIDEEDERGDEEQGGVA